MIRVGVPYLATPTTLPFVYDLVGYIYTLFSNFWLTIFPNLLSRRPASVTTLLCDLAGKWWKCPSSVLPDCSEEATSPTSTHTPTPTITSHTTCWNFSLEQFFKIYYFCILSDISNPLTLPLPEAQKLAEKKMEEAKQAAQEKCSIQ